MIRFVQDLSSEEVDLIYDAPVLTSILISGADGNIDNREINAAIQFTKSNARKTRALLYQFYSEIAENIEDKLQEVIQRYPEDPNARNQAIIVELQKLNGILPKLSKPFSVVYYVSLKTIANKIARSSGGFLGLFGTISREERQFLELSMINDPLKIFQ